MQIRVLEDGSLHITFNSKEHNLQVEILERLFEIFDDNEEMQDAVLAIADIVMGINKPLN